MFFNLINNFRIQEKKLNPSKKKQIVQSNSLASPCQIYVVSSFDHNRHLIIKTHFSSLKDKQICVIQLSQNNFAIELNKLIEIFQWIKNTSPYKPKKNPHAFLIDNIIRFGQDINHFNISSNRSASNHVTQIYRTSDQIFTWDITGKIERWGFNEEFKLPPIAPIVESIPGQSGLVTPFYPPILIGKLTSTVEDQILQNYDKLKECVYS